jgi:hypothetical protein
MIKRGVNVIVAVGSSTVVLAARAATDHIPIVFFSLAEIQSSSVSSKVFHGQDET